MVDFEFFGFSLWVHLALGRLGFRMPGPFGTWDFLPLYLWPIALAPDNLGFFDGGLQSEFIRTFFKAIPNFSVTCQHALHVYGVFRAEKVA